MIPTNANDGARMVTFNVIGELHGDPGHLLLVDDEAQCYDYDIAHDEILPVDVSDAWRVDVTERSELVLEAPIDMVVS